MVGRSSFFSGELCLLREGHFLGRRGVLQHRETEPSTPHLGPDRNPRPESSNQPLAGHVRPGVPAASKHLQQLLSATVHAHPPDLAGNVHTRRSGPRGDPAAISRAGHRSSGCSRHEHPDHHGRDSRDRFAAVPRRWRRLHSDLVPPRGGLPGLSLVRHRRTAARKPCIASHAPRPGRLHHPLISSLATMISSILTGALFL